MPDGAGVFLQFDGLYLRSAWAGFDPHEVGSEVTELQLVKFFLGIWIFMWLAGLAIVLLSIGERFLRSMLQLVGLTAVMAVVSSIAYFVGRS